MIRTTERFLLAVVLPLLLIITVTVQCLRCFHAY